MGFAEARFLKAGGWASEESKIFTVLWLGPERKGARRSLKGNMDFSNSVNRRHRYVGKVIWKANAETAAEEG